MFLLVLKRLKGLIEFYAYVIRDKGAVVYKIRCRSNINDRKSNNLKLFLFGNEIKKKKKHINKSATLNIC